MLYPMSPIIIPILLFAINIKFSGAQRSCEDASVWKHTGFNGPTNDGPYCELIKNLKDTKSRLETDHKRSSTYTNFHTDALNGPSETYSQNGYSLIVLPNGYEVAFSPDGKIMDPNNAKNKEIINKMKKPIEFPAFNHMPFPPFKPMEFQPLKPMEFPTFKPIQPVFNGNYDPSNTRNILAAQAEERRKEANERVKQLAAYAEERRIEAEERVKNGMARAEKRGTEALDRIKERMAQADERRRERKNFYGNN